MTTIIVASYVMHIFATQRSSRHFMIQYFPARYVGLCLNYETYCFYIAPCNGLQGAVAQYAAHQTRNTGGVKPLLFLISALGSFTCVTQHMGPTALRPIRGTKHHGQVSCFRTRGGFHKELGLVLSRVRTSNLSYM